MNNITIVDIDFKNNTLTLLYNNNCSTVYFSEIDELVGELVYRTCIVGCLNVQQEEENVTTPNDYTFPIDCKNGNIEISLQQHTEINILPTKPELHSLYKELLNKQLKVCLIKNCDINSIFPHTLNVDFKMEKME